MALLSLLRKREIVCSLGDKNRLNSTPSLFTRANHVQTDRTKDDCVAASESKQRSENSDRTTGMHNTCTSRKYIVLYMYMYLGNRNIVAHNKDKPTLLNLISDLFLIVILVALHLQKMQFIICVGSTHTHTPKKNAT